MKAKPSGRPSPLGGGAADQGLGHSTPPVSTSYVIRSESFHGSKTPYEKWRADWWYQRKGLGKMDRAGQRVQTSDIRSISPQDVMERKVRQLAIPYI